MDAFTKQIRKSEVLKREFAIEFLHFYRVKRDSLTGYQILFQAVPIADVGNLMTKFLQFSRDGQSRKDMATGSTTAYDESHTYLRLALILRITPTPIESKSKALPP